LGNDSVEDNSEGNNGKHAEDGFDLFNLGDGGGLLGRGNGDFVKEVELKCVWNYSLEEMEAISFIGLNQFT